jgi:hypothetical protein
MTTYREVAEPLLRKLQSQKQRIPLWEKIVLVACAAIVLVCIALLTITKAHAIGDGDPGSRASYNACGCQKNDYGSGWSRTARGVGSFGNYGQGYISSWSKQRSGINVFTPYNDGWQGISADKFQFATRVYSNGYVERGITMGSSGFIGEPGPRINDVGRISGSVSIERVMVFS